MVKNSILLASDEPMYSRWWRLCLEEEGLQVESSTIKELLKRPPTGPFYLVIIDIYRTWDKGLKLCAQLHPDKRVPTLLMTYMSAEPEQLKAYEAGADDCIIKPLTPPLFIAKVKAWLRWIHPEALERRDSLQVDGFHLDAARRILKTADGAAVRLSKLEFRLLHLLMRHPGQPLDWQTLIDQVWPPNVEHSQAAVKNLVYHLRRKIEPDPTRPRYLQKEADAYLFMGGRYHPAEEETQ
ncbi:MAG: response regulator transcription factor [Chloroflexi bacterium]|nr:response regulator transcription factor [Chloroflexota bacterium]MCI0645081.1 response regulator transcription factor [Chloroflexota bacterium]MCI0731916.1 response regulator transcription factor [Chloroflexota bacterium]